MKLRHKRKYKTLRTSYSFLVRDWIREMKLYLKDAPVEDPKDFIDRGEIIYSLNRFVNGQCLNFALACEKIFGLDAYVFMTTTENGYEGIAHCFCVVGQKNEEIYVLDAKGIRPMKQAVSEFVDFNVNNVYRLNKAFIQDWYSNFSTNRKKIKKQNTMTQRLNKIASYYIKVLFGDVKQQLKNEF